VTIRPEDDGGSGCGARDRITPVETHRSGTQNKTENTQPEKTKTTEDSRKQPDPNQQHTRSFLPENRKEKNQRKQKNPKKKNNTQKFYPPKKKKKKKKKLPNPEESEEQKHHRKQVRGN